MAKPYRVDRKGYEKARARYIKRVGSIIWYSNAIQADLFKVFWSIIGMDKQALALAIWHTFKSDAAQREMIEAVAAASLPANSRELRALKWICAQMNYLSGRRNDFVHTASMALGSGEMRRIEHVVDIWSAKKDRVDRFRKVPPVKLARTVESDLKALSRYAGHLGVEMLFVGTMPKMAERRMKWPRRPRLRAASLLQAHAQGSDPPLWPLL